MAEGGKKGGRIPRSLGVTSFGALSSARLAIKLSSQISNCNVVQYIGATAALRIPLAVFADKSVKTHHPVEEMRAIEITFIFRALRAPITLAIPVSWIKTIGYPQ